VTLSTPAEIQIVRWQSLRPNWASRDTGVPGHARWGVTPIGGPPGFEHMNREDGAIQTTSCTVGLMVFPPGVSSPGVHVHAEVNEVYVVAQGELCVLSGEGTETLLRRYDVAFIPAGVPHGVRNAGLEDGHLIWIKTGVEPVTPG
jgi:mannose-6-phosphate isomerase-like protein (cupin superfamily)